FAMGCVFLGVKAYEYWSKWDHQILPGRVHEKLDIPEWANRYVRTVQAQLEHVVEHGGVNADAKAACESLLDDIKASKVNAKEVNERVLGTDHVRKIDMPAKETGAPKVKGILEHDHSAH